MDNYTKGEWVVGVKYDKQGWPTYRLRDMANPNNKTEVEANARLIAQAPKCELWAQGAEAIAPVEEK